MANRYEQIIANVRSMIDQNAPPYHIDSYLAGEGLTPAQFRKLAAGPTIGGQAKEFFKGIPSGAVSLIETAGVGAAAALPEGYEEPTRKFIQEKGAALRKPFAPEIGYEETIPRKFGEALGSTGPFFALGPLGPLGRAAQIGLGVGAGAGEARLAAEEKGVTGADRAFATALGAPVGLLDLLAPEIKFGKQLITRAAVTGGVEGATEAAQKVAQNLIAKGIYDPEQPIFAGAGEEGAYGAGAGALTRFLMDAALGRKARGGTDTKTPPGTQPQTQPGEPSPTGPVGVPETATQLPLGQVPELSEGYEGFRAPPEPYREAEEKEGERQNRLFELGEKQKQYTVLNNEINRIREQINSLGATQEQIDAAAKQVAASSTEELQTLKQSGDPLVRLLAQGQEYVAAATELAKDVKKSAKGLEGAGLADYTAVPGQMSLDFDMPAMPRQRTGEGVVLGEEQVAPEGITPEQAEFFRQQRIADINARLNAGELITDADRAFLQMDAREQQASLEAQPTPDLLGDTTVAEPQPLELPPVKEERRPSFWLQPSNIPQSQMEVEELPTTEARPVTEADFKAMGIGGTNKKLRKAILDKDLADPEQRAEVKEVLTDFANDPNRSPKLIEGVNKFLTSPVFMEQGELDLRPKRKPRTKKEKEAADVIQPTELVEPTVEPSVAVADERGAAPAGGIAAPVAGGMDVTGGATEQSDVGAGAQPTSLVTAEKPVENWFKGVEEAAVTPSKGKNKLVQMPIDQFLRLAERDVPGSRRDKEERVQKIIDENGKFSETPWLSIEVNSKGNAKVTGHEGRHRARALKALGYTTIPVELRSNIRWSEQQDPEKFDYRKNWPTTLVGQEGDVVSFPVSRSEADIDYTPVTTAPAMEAPTAPTTAEGRVDLNTAVNRLMFEGNLKRGEATKLARDLADAYDEVGTQDITDAIQTVKGGKPLYRTRTVGRVGVSVAEVQKLVNNIISRWKNAPKIQVVQSVEELPDYLQKQIAEDKVNPPGTFDPDSETIFLIADNIENDVDAALTLAHEALGHYGLRSILGNSYTKVMDDVYNGNVNVRKQALRKMAEGLDKHTAVEEVLAEMAEQGVYNSAIQRVFNAIRQWLRSIGVNFKSVTDTEVREILANAQRFVVAGGPKAEGVAAFKGKPLFRTGTDAFKKWFGNSVVRNPDGSPKLMYHGTARDIEEFQPKQANAIFVTDNPRFAEGFSSTSEDYMLKELRSKLSKAQLNELYDKADAIAAREDTSPIDEFNNLLSELLPSRANIIPVYVSAQNPFDFQNQRHLGRLSEFISDNDLLQEVAAGNWEYIEDSTVQEIIRDLGHDGFYVMEGGRKNLAVYDSSQLKSPYNSGAYSAADRRILYRTKKEEPLTAEGQRAAALNERMKGIANEPEPDVDQTFKDRLTLMSEKAKGIPMAFRQAVVDKDAPVKEKIAAAFQNKITNSLGEIRGDVLNEQAQEATGVADQLMRRGGIRLSKDGLYEVYDRVENGQRISLDGVFEIIIEKLGAKLGSAKEAVTLSHRAFIAQRANEITKNNALLEKQAEDAEAKGNKRAAKKLRDQIIRVRASQEEIDAGMEAMRTFPELKQAFDVFTKYNEGIIDFLVSTGRLSPAQAQDWKDNVGYVPWTRVEEDTNKIESANKLRTGNVHLTELPKLDTEGSSKEIRNVLDNMVGNTIWAIRSGLKNRAAVKTLEQLPDAKELKTQDEVDRELKNNKQFVVFAYRDGERVAFRVQNQEDLAAFSNVVDVAGPVMKAFTVAATGLRSFVTHMPTFALSQLAQDTGRAMFLSGVKHPFSLPTKVLSNFYHVVTGGATDIQALGITGAYDGMPDHAMRRARERHGLQERNAFLRAWDKLEDFSLAADMAVRAAIYEQTMKETGDRVLAFHRAKEYINFKTAGNGQAVRILRQIVPFMNAYIQGMDILYRSLQGKGLSMEDRKAAMALFYTTGAKVAALSLIYAALVGDDDDYKGLDDYERDGNFIIPGTGLKIPVAPEIGFLFKVIPERLYQAIARAGTDRPVDATTFMRGMRDAAINAYGGVNLTPQLIKPAIEVATNYSFFTNNPIVGINMAGKETHLQFNNSTSELAKLFGYIGISPMKVDHLLRGYLGTAGGVMLDVTDAVADPNRMSKPINKLPLIKTFMYDDTGRGYKTEFYAFREEVDKVVNSVNTFKREGRAEELQEYLTEDKLKLYAMQGVVNRMEEQLGRLRQYRNIIANDPDLTPAEKREKTDEILKAEKDLLVAYNVPQLKQMAGR